MRFFFLLFTLPLWAQQQVLSSKGTPVEYVNIGIVGTSKGLITNEQGEFSLERLEAAPIDSIYFSHLSYKRKVLLAKDIQKKIILEETDIKLPKASFTLQKPKYYTLRGKGLPIVFKLYGEMKDGFEPTSNRKYLNAVNTCYIRFADGKIRPLSKHLGIPFSIKGYDYIMVNDQ